jgi:hypothetical protein
MRKLTPFNLLRSHSLNFSFAQEKYKPPTFCPFTTTPRGKHFKKAQLKKIMLTASASIKMQLYIFLI